MAENENERPVASEAGDSRSPGEMSRRESLRRATAVLALGLGAPAGLMAATGAPRGRAYRLAFYSREGERSLDVDIPERVAKILIGDLVFDELKVEWYGDDRRAARTLGSYRLNKATPKL